MKRAYFIILGCISLFILGFYDMTKLINQYENQ